MDILYRSVTPRYKGAATTQTAGGMSGLLRNLIGGQQPTYRRADGSPPARGAPSAGSWWIFGNGTPPYKAAPSVTPAPEAEATIETQSIGCVCSELDDVLEDEDDGEESDEATTEIYVW